MMYDDALVVTPQTCGLKCNTCVARPLHHQSVATNSPAQAECHTHCKTAEKHISLCTCIAVVRAPPTRILRDEIHGRIWEVLDSAKSRSQSRGRAKGGYQLFIYIYACFLCLNVDVCVRPPTAPT